MFNSILESIFGCSHRKTTFPLTPRCNGVGRSAKSSGDPHGAYVVCLDCGREFGYDWNAMRRALDGPERRSATASQSRDADLTPDLHSGSMTAQPL